MCVGVWSGLGWGEGRLGGRSGDAQVQQARVQSATQGRGDTRTQSSKQSRAKSAAAVNSQMNGKQAKRTTSCTMCSLGLNLTALSNMRSRSWPLIIIII